MIEAATQECSISRVFDAPRELVYQAWLESFTTLSRLLAGMS